MGVLVPAASWAIDWPQEIVSDEGTIVVYQPQPEALDGNRLSARAAMSLELDGQEEPIFGAFWFDARLDTNTDAGIAVIRDVTVTAVRWPGANDAAGQVSTAIGEVAFPETCFELSRYRMGGMQRPPAGGGGRLRR